MIYDAVIILGKNVGYLGSKKKIRNSKNYLSRKSEVNAIAAGLIYKNGKTKKLIFTGGKTTGENYPSEAEAMKNFLLLKFPDIPDESILLEDKSFDTKQNVEFTKEIINENNFRNIAFLTTSSHIKRSKMLFEKIALTLDSISSQEIIKKYSPEILEEYKDEFGISEIFLERLALIFQSTPIISAWGNFLIEKRRQLD